MKNIIYSFIIFLFCSCQTEQKINGVTLNASSYEIILGDNDPILYNSPIEIILNAKDGIQIKDLKINKYLSANPAGTDTTTNKFTYNVFNERKDIRFSNKTDAIFWVDGEKMIAQYVESDKIILFKNITKNN